MQIPTIDALRAQGTPQWFGLGFIQLKINDHQRYHFWHPDLAPDVGAEEVHDHRYAFTSKVLRGNILNEIYSCTPATNTVMVMENVSCKEGEEAQYITDVYSELISSALMVEGSHYFMRADTFHRTVPQTKAVTFLHRNSIVKPYARVVRHRDLERVCPFANKMEESAIWDTIEDCLNDKAGYHLTEIEKGELGHPSKIVEEARELLDAHQQGSRIMAAVELSDLYGAMRAYMVDHSGGLTFEDLDTMSKITERAFRNGRR